MEITEIPLEEIDLSEFNVRKNLDDGQFDSSIEDLANSIEKQGLLSPITVFEKPNGRYGLVAGQRRFMACKFLNLKTISAIVRTNMSDTDATAVSLVENVHRADMNPNDKARAFKVLLDKFGDLRSVCRETGIGAQTIKKYIQLLDLAPELRDRLSAGDIKNTDALARLAQRFDDADSQIQVWEGIGGFTQAVQTEIIKRAAPDLSNLDDLIGEAAEGAFDMTVVKNCPFDCPTIPSALRIEVDRMVKSYKLAHASIEDAG